MVGPSLSRRKFLEDCFLKKGLVFGTLPSLLSACGPGNKKMDANESAADSGSCDDLSGVPEHDLKVRQTFAYVEESPVAESRCDNCKLWLPPKAGSRCGGCLLFKGPVVALGYCTYWAPQE